MRASWCVVRARAVNSDSPSARVVQEVHAVIRERVELFGSRCGRDTHSQGNHELVGGAEKEKGAREGQAFHDVGLHVVDGGVQVVL